MNAIRCKTKEEKDFCNEFQTEGYISFTDNGDSVGNRRYEYHTQKINVIVEFEEYYRMICDKSWKAREWDCFKKSPTTVD